MVIIIGPVLTAHCSSYHFQSALLRLNQTFSPRQLRMIGAWCAWHFGPESLPVAGSGGDRSRMGNPVGSGQNLGSGFSRSHSQYPYAHVPITPSRSSL